MTIEKRSRGTGQRYHYRAKRDGDQVKKEYVGTCSDPIVAIMARADRLRKAENRARREAVAREQEWYGTTNDLLQQYCLQLEAMLVAWMNTRGYRRSRSGKWQPIKRRQHTEMEKSDFLALVKRAEQGNEEAAAQIRDLMEHDIDTWRPFGDLSHHVKELFLDQMTGDNVVARESIRLHVDRFKQEFSAESSSPIRALLVDQVILCWLDFHYQGIMALRGGNSKTTVDRLERRKEAALKHYQSALQDLTECDATLSDDVLPLVFASDGD